MGREYPRQPVVGVGAVIVDDDRVLLVRRAMEPSRGRWSIPGGVVELGEGLEEALRREVREETGLSVEVVERCAVLDRIYRDEWGRVRYHYVLVDFTCRPTGGELRAGGDIGEARWVPLSDLDRYQPMTKGTADVIREAHRACALGFPGSGVLQARGGFSAAPGRVYGCREFTVPG